MDKPLPFIVEKGKEIMLQKLESNIETEDLNQIINILLDEVKNCKRFCDSLKDKEHFDQIFGELRIIAEKIGKDYINKKNNKEKENQEKYNELKEKLLKEQQKIDLERRLNEGGGDCRRLRNRYFPIPNYNGCSIVDALKNIGAESSYNYRCTIAAKNGIYGYNGRAEQNTHMLNLLKSGNLLKP